jgi:hypothetical protein
MKHVGPHFHLPDPSEAKRMELKDWFVLAIAFRRSVALPTLAAAIHPVN